MKRFQPGVCFLVTSSIELYWETSIAKECLQKTLPTQALMTADIYKGGEKYFLTRQRLFDLQHSSVSSMSVFSLFMPRTAKRDFGGSAVWLTNIAYVPLSLEHLFCLLFGGKYLSLLAFDHFLNHFKRLVKCLSLNRFILRQKGELNQS